MFDFYYQQGSNRRKLYRVTGVSCSVGSARSNDLVLSTRHIAKRHAQWRLTANGLFIEDLGSASGTWVNRERIQKYGPLSELDEITIGDVSCWLDKAPSPL
ncbi:MAG: FHA domain-containing protein, partial [Gammaproteobacteria bacterium]|nr:FHA domain-containing protein [Gammaproteobacteria bacterium]